MTWWDITVRKEFGKYSCLQKQKPLHDDAAMIDILSPTPFVADVFEQTF